MAGARQYLVTLVLVVTALEVGCTRHITMVPQGHRLVEHIPANGAIHAYPGFPPLESKAGPTVAVFFTTTKDLEDIAKFWAHHLYYRLLPCSRLSHGFQLFEGTVFAATDEERSEVLGPHLEPGQALYKVHVPLDLQFVVRLAEGLGGLDLPPYLDEARSSGLCIQIGGGHMWGGAVFSNVIPAPVVIHGNEMVVLNDTSG